MGVLGRDDEHTGSFADLIGDLKVSEKHAGSLRAKQLNMVSKMTVVMVLANRGR